MGNRVRYKRQFRLGENQNLTYPTFDIYKSYSVYLQGEATLSKTFSVSKMQLFIYAPLHCFELQRETQQDFTPAAAKDKDLGAISEIRVMTN